MFGVVVVVGLVCVVVYLVNGIEWCVVCGWCVEVFFDYLVVGM